MATNVELYEALKPHVGKEAAGMIADVVPPARDLATKQDIAELRTELHKEIGSLRGTLLGYFIPLWVMMGSMSLAIVGLVATRS
jgi:hypothetical protein